MPLITGGALLKLGAIKILKGTKIKVNKATLTRAAISFKRMAVRQRVQREILNRIRERLGNNWGGKDYEAYRLEHQRLCEEYDEMIDCFESCSKYLEEVAATFEDLQNSLETRATEISSPRGR